MATGQDKLDVPFIAFVHFALIVVAIGQGQHGREQFKDVRSGMEVIMLTGNTSVDDALELMKLGTFDYLMKPVNLEELLYKIEDAYARKQINERQLSAGLA